MMKSYMQRKMDLINQQLNEIYTENMALNKDLAKAMNYSLMAGGKRLRPILIMAAADALGVDGEKFLRLSTSIEFIHTYSLIFFIYLSSCFTILKPLCNTFRGFNTFNFSAITSI